MTDKKLPQSFYISNNILDISKILLGKVLVTKLNGKKTTGIIIEVEAYLGVKDKASHSYNNKRTKRTEPMYLKGGIGYIYLCYGIHYMLNVVVGEINTPYAILIRSVEPLSGEKTMLKRRNLNKITESLTNGPGKLTQAFGITSTLNYEPLISDKIWIEDRGINVKEKNILSSKRIGVDYAGEDAKLPYRFYIKNNKWVSK